MQCLLLLYPFFIIVLVLNRLPTYVVCLRGMWYITTCYLQTNLDTSHVAMYVTNETFWDSTHYKQSIQIKHRVYESKFFLHVLSKESGASLVHPEPEPEDQNCCNSKAKNHEINDQKPLQFNSFILMSY